MTHVAKGKLDFGQTDLECSKFFLSLQAVLLKLVLVKRPFVW